MRFCIPSICSLSNVLMNPSNSAIDGTIGDGVCSLGKEGERLSIGILCSGKYECVCAGLQTELATEPSPCWPSSISNDSLFLGSTLSDVRTSWMSICSSQPLGRSGSASPDLLLRYSSFTPFTSAVCCSSRSWTYSLLYARSFGLRFLVYTHTASSRLHRLHWLLPLHCRALLVGSSFLWLLFTYLYLAYPASVAGS